MSSAPWTPAAADRSATALELETRQASSSGLGAETVFFLRALGWVGWLGLALTALGLAAMFVAQPQLQEDNAQSDAQIAAMTQRLRLLQDPHTAIAVRDPVAALIGALPPASAIPDFVAAIQRRADEAAVQIDRTEYRVQSVLGHGAQRYRLSFPAHTDYPHLRTWLEALLHDYPSLTVDELTLRREVDGGEELEAHIGVSFLARTIR
jgi:hypothetical protein